MPPTDNTPDFDSMSPEELMAWMETLAERQGANSEEFTTEQRFDIAEVDPDSVQDTGPGYIPYGMTEEQWAEKQQQEEEKKAAKRAQQQAASPPAPASVPETTPAPAPPQPAAASAGGEPDFDSMSPEELMAWMETLAERQGATEGFTTENRVEIAELDPDNMQDTGPGYIPYGMSEEKWAEKQQQEEEQKAAKRAQQQATPPPSTPEPVQEIPAPTPELEIPDLPDLTPATDDAQFELPGLEMDIESTTQASTGGLDWLEDLAAEQDSDFPQMDLSGLGDDLSSGGLDLASLEDEEETQASDTMSWLDDLAQGEDNMPEFSIPTDEPEVAPPPEPAQPEPAMEMPELDFDVDDEELAAADGDDPMNWLESLAREQGADPEEFTTSADLSVGDESAQDEEIAGYTFESDTVGDPLAGLDDIDQLDTVNLQDQTDPEAWLEGLATSQSGAPTSSSTDDTDETKEDHTAQFKNDPLVQSAKQDNVMQALTSGGDVSSDDVRGWMDNLLSQGVERSDDQGFKVPEEAVEEEEGDLEANIPDWLVDQVGPPPEAFAGEDAQKPAFVGDVDASDDVEQEIPDWLQESAPTQDEEGLAAIFDDAATEDDVDLDDETAVAPDMVDSNMRETTLTIGDEVIVTDDQWAVAFELERTGHMPDEVRELAQDAAGILEEATLPPESALPQGEPEAVPDWLSDVSDTPAPQAPVASSPPPPVVEEVEAVALSEDEMPDWLRDMETQHDMEAVDEGDTPNWLQGSDVDDEDVPEWLRDTVTMDESDEIETIDPNIFTQQEPAEEEVPQPVTPAPQPVAMVPVQSPAPVAVSMSAEQAGEAIESARTSINEGNLDDGLANYENVIRANAQLDDVIGDLEKLVKDNTAKKNPLVHRVLGDGLMRQGRLQEALDTYRKALNLL